MNNLQKNMIRVLYAIAKPPIVAIMKIAEVDHFAPVPNVEDYIEGVELMKELLENNEEVSE